MKFDTEGTYTLQYKAVDECGNETIEDRTVDVVSYRTVLYNDGTLIINEKSTDIDPNIAKHGAMQFNYPPLDSRNPYVFNSGAERPWTRQKDSIIAVELGSPISPTSTAFWFWSLQQCASIDLTGLDTSQVTSMRSMFEYCVKLTQLNMPPLDTSSVTTMKLMFSRCEMLVALDLSSFDTANVTDMEEMFSDCVALTALNVSSFDTSNVTTMKGMFSSCAALESLDISSFRTSKVTTMQDMFSACTKVQTLDLSNFDTSQVTSMASMFYACLALTTLDISSFNTSQVTSMANMFQRCGALVALDASSLTGISVTHISQMFMQCTKLQTLDISNFVLNNDGNVVADDMFAYSKALKTIYASALFDNTKLSTSGTLFANMNALIGGAGTRWDRFNINYAYARIDNPPDAPGYFTLKA